MIKYYRIFLDAGHGGKDSGAVNQKYKVKESEVTLKICKQLKKCFKSKKRKIKLSRLIDKTLDLNKRWKKANEWGADLVLSIHLNSYSDKSVRGTEAYYYGNNDRVMAESIAESVAEGIRVRNRGAKEYAWAMTKYPDGEAVLVEVDFVSNNKFAELCKSKSYIKKIARMIFEGIRRVEGEIF